MKLFTLITGTVAVGLSMLLANVQVNAAPQPKTKLRPTKTVLLYPEGQNTDKGIEENGKTITAGPGVSNGLTGPEK